MTQKGKQAHSSKVGGGGGTTKLLLDSNTGSGTAGCHVLCKISPEVLKKRGRQPWEFVKNEDTLHGGGQEGLGKGSRMRPSRRTRYEGGGGRFRDP